MDIWTRLSASSKPILIYGTGDGADKILDAFDIFGITAAGVFASDGFVRERNFRGYKVTSYVEATARFGDEIIIVVAFASRLHEVIARVELLADRHELYIADVPVVFDGALVDNLWTDSYSSTHLPEIETARGFLCDAESRALFDDMCEYKRTGELRLLSRTAGRDEIWRLAGAERCKAYCDLGAYTGDTVSEAVKLMPGLEYILAAEPDPASFRRLASLCFGDIELDARNAAAWDTTCALPFAASRGRGSKVAGNGKSTATADTAAAVTAAADTADSMLNGKPAGLIKYDVEGAEARALLGSARTIAKFSPGLIVSAYHRSEDLYALPVLIKRLNPGYRLYLRRGRCFPAWELDIIAVADRPEANRGALACIL